MSFLAETRSNLVNLVGAHRRSGPDTGYKMPFGPKESYILQGGENDPGRQSLTLTLAVNPFSRASQTLNIESLNSKSFGLQKRT